jgi:hypothetical protein
MSGVDYIQSLYFHLHLHEGWSSRNYNFGAWSLLEIFMGAEIIFHRNVTLPWIADLNIFVVRSMPFHCQDSQECWSAIYVFTAWVPQRFWYGIPLVYNGRSCQRIRNKFKPNMMKCKAFRSSRRIMHVFCWINKSITRPPIGQKPSYKDQHISYYIRLSIILGEWEMNIPYNRKPRIIS